MLLYPDMSRQTYDGSETFVFAAPCIKDEFYQLLRNGKTVKSGDRLPYLVTGEKEDQVCLILRHDYDTDEQALETAAWIRVAHEGFNGIIYAMQYIDAPAFGSIASIVARTAGANPKQVKHIDLTQE